MFYFVIYLIFVFVFVSLFVGIRQYMVKKYIIKHPYLDAPIAAAFFGVAWPIGFPVYGGYLLGLFIGSIKINKG